MTRVLLLMGVLWGLNLPTTAHATGHDVVVVDLLYGTTISSFGGATKWQPSLWLDGSYGVVGPLHLGAYFQWLGSEFGLKDPGFGGGAFVALRKNINKARLSAAFGGGGLGVPVPREAPETGFRKEKSGSITALVGIGFGFLDFMGFEFRGRWARYFKMPPGTPDNAWSLEAGLSVFIR
ncbi:MAG: hypothetical protein AAF436_05430 [Myxococcota bacterium]